MKTRSNNTEILNKFNTEHLSRNENHNINMKQIVWLLVFSIAMGMLESAVVIYLREIYYPNGFSFPLNIINNQTVAMVELIREAATLVMLVAVGFLFGHNFSTRFAGFMFSFAIWDLFYYFFLKLLLNWPDNLLTWDVLFLLPIIWVGPVLAPIIVSLTMIFFAFRLVSIDRKIGNIKFELKDWLFLLIPTFIIFLSFVIDNLIYLSELYGVGRLFSLSEKDYFLNLTQYIPVQFNWWLFALGELGVLGFIVRFGNKS